MSTQPLETHPAFDALPRPRAGFFLWAHLMLLAIVLLGFSPTFYLRPAFPHSAPLPAFLYVHGGVLTGWFLLAVAQGMLIRSHRLRWHRKLGYTAAGYAALVVVFGLLANFRLIDQIDSPADGENIVIWGNFFTLIVFSAFVALAVVFRKKPDTHKRLTLLASAAIIGPALARLPRWPIFGGGLEAGRNYAIGGLLLLFALLLVYDVLTRRRPHPVTWCGIFAIVASLGGAVFLGVTGVGYRVLHG